MQQLSVYLFPICAITCVVVLIYLLFKVIKLSRSQMVLQSQLAGNDLLISELKEQVDALRITQDKKLTQWQSWQVEQEQVTGQLEHRTKQLNDSIKNLNQALEELSSQQPEDKLYSRAQKMVKLGADVDEIVAQCQLPRVEAEMLIAMYQRQSTSK